ncbi:MAG: carbon dioxide concentrating mechanism protein [Phormidesmis sp. CAN_BIN36]|nr:carbon dioxide concentrating mechanism protein [Phormidesmis sp. CAN_BIN36]
MHPLPLQLCPIDTAHYLVSGDVNIHEGVAIAPGVLLQAAPGSKIIIGAGACIGIGSVLHVHEGTLRIGAGASIGAGVLLVGQVTIGDRACIGSATTILDSAIEAGALVAPGSLLGDRSRPSKALEEPAPAPELPSDPWAESQTLSQPESLPADPPPEELPSEPPSPEPDPVVVANVYGQSYVNNLLVRLFPQNQQNYNLPDNGHSVNGNS